MADKSCVTNAVKFQMCLRSLVARVIEHASSGACLLKGKHMVWRKQDLNMSKEMLQQGQRGGGRVVAGC